MSGVLAVDGGQSGIRARHSGAPTVVEVEGVSRQEGDTVSAVAQSIVTAWERLGSPGAARVVLGLTTAPTDPAGLDRLAQLVAERLGADEVWLCDDTVTAHAGALAGGWGVCLQVGTGVACLAVPESGGDPVVIDGHGYLLGDDGGGYWIGREGLRAALRSNDGRGDATTLAAAAETRFGALGDLHVRLHDHPRAVNEIAQFARAVTEAAEAGDPMAVGIVAAAAESLAVTVGAAVRAVDSGHEVPVALGGRLLENPMLRELVRGGIHRSAPTARVRDAEGSPLDGALGLGTGVLADRYGSAIHHWRKDGSR